MSSVEEQPVEAQVAIDVSSILAEGEAKSSKRDWSRDRSRFTRRIRPKPNRRGILPASLIPSPLLPSALIPSLSPRTDLEQSLLLHARDGIQLLVNSIWSRPTRVVDDGVVAELPPISTPLPREKPLPKPKPMTKWQAFAATKGIAPKPRRDRLVFDDEKQDWVPKWGYKGKNKDTENQWIVEVPKDKDANFDPVQASKEDRKARKLKNEGQKLKNQQRAAANSAKEASTSGKTNLAEREIRKKVIERELKITKTSTASLGKFDDKLKGEKKEKNVKRKFEANETDANSERTKSMAILTKIGATPSNKRTKVSDDAPTAGKSDDIINSRKAIKHLTGGRGAMSLEGKRGSGRGRGRGGRGRGGK